MMVLNTIQVHEASLYSHYVFLAILLLSFVGTIYKRHSYQMLLYVSTFVFVLGTYGIQRSQLLLPYLPEFLVNATIKIILVLIWMLVIFIILAAYRHFDSYVRTKPYRDYKQNEYLIRKVLNGMPILKHQSWYQKILKLFNLQMLNQDYVDFYIGEEVGIENGIDRG